MAEGWYDEWGAWHEANPPDLGYSMVHDPRPRLRVVPPMEAAEAPEPAAEAIVAPATALPPRGGLGPVPEGKDGSEGVWVGGVWQERPPKPKVDPVKGLRLYLAMIREMFSEEER